MKIATRMSALLAVALLMTGCVTTSASMLGTATTTRPQLPPEQVALYRVPDQVPGRYEEIALLSAVGDSDVTDEAEMFASMKEKAGELGANGIILGTVIEPSAEAEVAATVFGLSAQRRGKAVAIYVFPEPLP